MLHDYKVWRTGKLDHNVVFLQFLLISETQDILILKLALSDNLKYKNHANNDDKNKSYRYNWFHTLSSHVESFTWKVQGLLRRAGKFWHLWNWTAHNFPSPAKKLNREKMKFEKSTKNIPKYENLSKQPVSNGFLAWRELNVKSVTAWVPVSQFLALQEIEQITNFRHQQTCWKSEKVKF